MATILVLYYSRTGKTAELARQVARGIAEVDGVDARLRSVPPVAAVTQTARPPVPACRLLIGRSVAWAFF